MRARDSGGALGKTFGQALNRRGHKAIGGKGGDPFPNKLVGSLGADGRHRQLLSPIGVKQIFNLLRVGHGLPVFLKNGLEADTALARKQVFYRCVGCFLPDRCLVADGGEG